MFCLLLILIKYFYYNEWFLFPIVDEDNINQQHRHGPMAFYSNYIREEKEKYTLSRSILEKWNVTSICYLGGVVSDVFLFVLSASRSTCVSL
jgi:hypothetical protein